jgi:uncharacterized repeat protein (TIGR03803 family)
MNIRKSWSFALASVLPAASLVAGCSSSGLPAPQRGAASPAQLFGCGEPVPQSALPIVLSRAMATVCKTSAASASSTSLSMNPTRPAASGEVVLYRFLGRRDGALPGDGLIADDAGALYGTTVYGGTHDDGTVYKLTPAGSGYVESVLYSFKGGKDGANPGGRLIAGPSGTLYGTTTLGGDLACANVLGKGCGTVFALTHSGSRYIKRTLYAFKGYPSDGTQPDTLVANASGALYGSTSFGGDSGKCPTEGPGCGTVFRLSESGTSYQESVLHSFDGGHDGLNPTDGLVMDNSGALYGTTFFGGRTGNGTVYRLLPAKRGYAERILYSFKGAPDGYGPNGSLILDPAGTLYGTTLNGGTGCGSGGCGTAFALRASGSAYVETVLYNFQGGYDAAFPTGGLLVSKNGALYGSSGDGGSMYCDHGGCGTVFELTPSGSTYTDRVLYAFKGGRSDGQIPLGTLLRKRDRLYGATGYGGVRDNGTAFSVMLH